MNLRRGSGTKSYVRLLPKQRSAAAPPPPFPRPESMRFVLSPVRALVDSPASPAPANEADPSAFRNSIFGRGGDVVPFIFFAVRYAIVARG